MTPQGYTAVYLHGVPQVRQHVHYAAHALSTCTNQNTQRKGTTRFTPIRAQDETAHKEVCANQSTG